MTFVRLLPLGLLLFACSRSSHDAQCRQVLADHQWTVTVAVETVKGATGVPGEVRSYDITRGAGVIRVHCAVVDGEVAAITTENGLSIYHR